MQPTILMRSLLAPLTALIPAQPAPAAAQSVAELKDCARLTHDQALEKLRSSPEGLLAREAIDRLLTYGPNTVAHEARKSAARRLLDLFFTPLSIFCSCWLRFLTSPARPKVRS